MQWLIDKEIKFEVFNSIIWFRRSDMHKSEYLYKILFIEISINFLLFFKII